MSEGTIIQATTLEIYCVALLKANGVTSEQAKVVANNIVWSELVGRQNFGVLRVPLYLDRLRAGGLNGKCTPEFQQKTDTIGLLDGDCGFGQFAAHVAMDHAIKMSREQGVGIVAVRNSNFFGTGAYFANLACNANVLGIAASNSFPKVVAHRGLTPVFGTNPFAFGAPRRNGEHLLVDLSTSALAGSTVREHIANGTPLPEGLAIDGEGKPITDPRHVRDGALLPFGGAKGYCLAFMVEVLCGVLTGAGVSDGVSSMYDTLSESGDNGHFMLAIDPAQFMSRAIYFDRLEALMTTIVSSGAADDTVRIPGEIRWQCYEEKTAYGIRLEQNICNDLERISAPCGVSVPWKQ